MGKSLRIAFAGLAGSGKSTAADYLVRSHHFHRLSYASPFKKMLLSLLVDAGVGPITAKEMIYGSLKEVAHESLAMRSPRHALQTLGSEWGRGCISPDIWRRILLRKSQMLTSSGFSIVVDDLRFPCEAEALRSEGYLLVRLQREGSGTSSNHSSEAQDFPIDKEISNNGSVEDLQSQIDDMIFSL